jgi:acetoin utilization deacetylase AcuC-like enzyme
MTVAVLTHAHAARHRPPEGHPERPDRYAAALRGTQGLDVAWVEPAEAGDAELRALHPQAYLDALARAEPPEGGEEVALDADTWLSPGSLRAARLGAGAALRAVDLVMEGTHSAAFALMRPPGHHALAARPMGFCLFGNVALAARRALDRHGAGRVAIVDFDVHHGNGTEALVEEDGRILFCSTHQAPFYPGTGDASHEGPHGTVVNVPLPAGTGSAAFRAAVEARTLPRVAAHAPDLVLISAGFDADARDPLGGLRLGPADFAWITERLVGLAGGRVASVLEGGYDLDALAEGVAAHLGALGG